MFNKYSNYKVEDFMEDDNFLDFILSNNTSKFKEWEDLRSQYPEIKSKMDEAKEIILSLKYQKILPRTGSKDQIWQNIKKSIVAEPKVLKSRQRIWPYLAAAASIAVLLYFSFFKKELVTETSPIALIKSVLLPDSSIITLNAESEVSYDRLSYSNDRQIKLKGEAYFQIKKGKPFRVITDLGKVEVLGTTFNVYARKDIMNVTCLVGKVLVRFISENKDYILTQGMKLSSEAKKINSSNFNPEEYKFWRDGYFYYENAPLAQVMEEMQRQYQLSDIKYSNNILNYRYTGFFKKDKISDALQSVFLPLKLRAEVKNGVLSIQE